MINSGPWTGLDIEAGKAVTIDTLENTNAGTRKITYRLRDWGISRQRYWGSPHPDNSLPSLRSSASTRKTVTCNPA